ncbi:hypothetical protein LEMLEM_LOCUS18010, partial [Lemmus lemmus]
MMDSLHQYWENFWAGQNSIMASWHFEQQDLCDAKDNLKEVPGMALLAVS